MKTKLNAPTTIGIVVIIATSLATVALLALFVLQNPNIPRSVWLQTCLPPFPNPAPLIAYAAYNGNNWIPCITAVCGGLLGGGLLFSGLKNNQK
jgi:hypothetical protein